MKLTALPVLLFCVVLGTAVGMILNPLTTRHDQVQLALWLEVAHRVCTSVGGLGTFVALIYVTRQFHLMQSQSELVQRNIVASMNAQLYTRLDSFNRFVFEHYQEYDLLDQPYQPAESADRRSKMHRICELGFTFFEEIYKHHVRWKLLDTEDWDEWEQNLMHFLSKPYVRGYWRQIAVRYSTTFQGLVNDLVSRLETSGTPAISSPSSLANQDGT